VSRNCSHDADDRRAAATRDGYCPICLKVAVSDRDALRDELARARAVLAVVEDYQGAHAEDFQEAVTAAWRKGQR